MVQSPSVKTGSITPKTRARLLAAFTALKRLALVQCDGNVFAFCHHHFCHWHLEHCRHRQPPLEEAPRHRGHYSDGTMAPQHLGPHPGHPAQPRPSRGGVGIPRGRPSPGRPSAAPGPPERGGRRGLESRRGPGTRGRRRGAPWPLLGGALPTWVLGGGPGRRPPDVPPAVARLLGASAVALGPACRAERQAPRARAAFPRGPAAPRGRLSRPRVPGRAGRGPASALLLAPVSLPEAATGSVHEP